MLTDETIRVWLTLSLVHFIINFRYLLVKSLFFWFLYLLFRLSRLFRLSYLFLGYSCLLFSYFFRSCCLFLRIWFLGSRNSFICWLRSYLNSWFFSRYFNFFCGIVGWFALNLSGFLNFSDRSFIFNFGWCLSLLSSCCSCSCSILCWLYCSLIHLSLTILDLFCIILFFSWVFLSQMDHSLLFNIHLSGITFVLSTISSQRCRILCLCFIISLINLSNSSFIFDWSWLRFSLYIFFLLWGSLLNWCWCWWIVWRCLSNLSSIAFWSFFF